MTQNHKAVIWNFDFLSAPPDGYLLAYQASTGLWIPVNVPLGINRSVGTTIVFGASPYTVLSTDDFLPVNSSGGNITVNLPSSPITGKGYTIADTSGTSGTNSITINGNGFQIIGNGSYVINSNYGELTVIFNGTNWTKV